MPVTNFGNLTSSKTPTSVVNVTRVVILTNGVTLKSVLTVSTVVMTLSFVVTPASVQQQLYLYSTLNYIYIYTDDEEAQEARIVKRDKMRSQDPIRDRIETFILMKQRFV